MPKKSKTKLKTKLSKQLKKAAKKDTNPGLLLRDGNGQFYRVPFSKLEKFQISGKDAAKELKKIEKLGIGTPEVLSGCTDRPCVNFTGGKF